MRPRDRRCGSLAAAEALPRRESRSGDATEWIRETMRLVGDLFSYVWSGRDNNCNSYVLAGVLKGDRHVLIDPGHVTTPALREPGLQSLFERMEDDGIDPTAIGLVLLTHFHPDHSEAANVLREKTRALVALHEAEADLYSSFGGKLDLLLGEGDLDLGTESPVRLTVFHSPGHSPGHATFLLGARKSADRRRPDLLSEHWACGSSRRGRQGAEEQHQQIVGAGHRIRALRPSLRPFGGHRGCG